VGDVDTGDKEGVWDSDTTKKSSCAPSDLLSGEVVDFNGDRGLL